MRLSALERKILNCIQQDFPLESKPFEILSKQIGIKEGELLEKIKQLKERGIIRSFSVGISHRKLGFKSSLVALKVPSKRIEDIAKKIIQHQEVTHCFLREGEFNLWTVLIYKNKMLTNFLNKMAKEVGKENILNFKTLRQYKLKTRLEI